MTKFITLFNFGKLSAKIIYLFLKNINEIRQFFFKIKLICISVTNVYVYINEIKFTPYKCLLEERLFDL